MAIKLSDFKKKTKTIMIDYQGEQLNVTYFINAITPSFLSEQLIVDQVKEAIAEWDVLDEKGKPIPVLESADFLSINFLRAVIGEVLNDIHSPVDDDEKKD